MWSQSCPIFTSWHHQLSQKHRHTHTHISSNVLTILATIPYPVRYFNLAFYNVASLAEFSYFSQKCALLPSPPLHPQYNIPLYTVYPLILMPKSSFNDLTIMVSIGRNDCLNLDSSLGRIFNRSRCRPQTIYYFYFRPLIKSRFDPTKIYEKASISCSLRIL